MTPDTAQITNRKLKCPEVMKGRCQIPPAGPRAWSRRSREAVAVLVFTVWRGKVAALDVTAGPDGLAGQCNRPRLTVREAGAVGGSRG